MSKISKEKQNIMFNVSLNISVKKDIIIIKLSF